MSDMGITEEGLAASFGGLADIGPSAETIQSAINQGIIAPEFAPSAPQMTPEEAQAAFNATYGFRNTLLDQNAAGAAAGPPLPWARHCCWCCCWHAPAVGLPLLLLRLLARACCRPATAAGAAAGTPLLWACHCC